MLTLEQTLENLMKYALLTDPTILDHLQPGIERVALESIAPFSLPAEVTELYCWHNGCRETASGRDLPLFYYHRFLPAEEAVEIHREWVEVNQKIGQEGYDPDLFPVFAFMGEYYAVRCGPPDRHLGAVHFIYHGDVQVYDRLTTMLAAILECYDTSAYQIQNGEHLVDEERVAQIKAKWNACRRLPEGEILGYHP